MSALYAALMAVPVPVVKTIKFIFIKKTVTILSSLKRKSLRGRIRYNTIKLMNTTNVHTILDY